MKSAVNFIHTDMNDQVKISTKPKKRYSLVSLKITIIIILWPHSEDPMVEMRRVEARRQIRVPSKAQSAASYSRRWVDCVDRQLQCRSFCLCRCAILFWKKKEIFKRKQPTFWLWWWWRWGKNACDSVEIRLEIWKNNNAKSIAVFYTFLCSSNFCLQL